MISTVAKMVAVLSVLILTYAWIHHASRYSVATAERAHWLAEGSADSANLIGDPAAETCVAIRATLIGSPRIVMALDEQEIAPRARYRLFRSADGKCVGESVVGSASRLHPTTRISFHTPWNGAGSYGFSIPRGNRVRILSILDDNSYEEDNAWPLIVCGGWLALLLAWIFERRTLSEQHRATALTACGFIAITGAVTVFLVGPLQSPDEHVHFSAAVARSAWAGSPSTAMSELDGSLDLSQVRGDPDTHIDTSVFSGAPVAAPAPTYDVTYANALSYPSVTAASLLAGPIRSLPQALRGYYMARLVGLALLLLAVFGAARVSNWEMPVSFIVLASSPLFLQQATAIGTDSVALFGTPLAIAACIATRAEFSWSRWSLVCGAALLITLCKLNAAGVCLLPLCCLEPRHWVWIRKRWRPLTAAIAIGAVAFIIFLNHSLLGTMNRFGHEQARVNMRLLSTWAGWRWFIAATLRVASDYAKFPLLVSPLGWLDTVIDEFHLQLLAVSFSLALVTDFAFLIWRHRLNEWRPALKWLTLSSTHLVLAWIISSYCQYITWTDPASGHIEGVQGRYFLPSLEFATLMLLFDAGSRWVSKDHRVVVAEKMVRSVVLAVLVVVAMANASLLAVNLLSRYW